MYYIYEFCLHGKTFVIFLAKIKKKKLGKLCGQTCGILPLKFSTDAERYAASFVKKSLTEGCNYVFDEINKEI